MRAVYKYTDIYKHTIHIVGLYAYGRDASPRGRSFVMYASDDTTTVGTPCFFGRTKIKLDGLFVYY